MSGKQVQRFAEQHHARTTFLRVPSAEWQAVKTGRKPEFRTEHVRLWIAELPLPLPVVAYALNQRRGWHDAQLMVLEEAWIEPLGAISRESLDAEGYESLHEFRRAWCLRTKKRFKPEVKVLVTRVRHWRGPLDERLFADTIFHRLYGEWT